MKIVRDILVERGLMHADVVAIRVHGLKQEEALVDLHTPVAEEIQFDLVRRNEPLGLEVIRHSTAHVMADAVQKLFPGTKVTFGPSTEDGFYYDFDRRDGSFTDEDLIQIEIKMREIIAQKSAFQRRVISRQEALAMFQKMGETYKVEWMNTLPENEVFTLYIHGAAGHEWVDFCKGPHVPDTSYLAAIKLMSVGGAYWRGDERNPMLQRIRGTAFSSKEALDLFLKQRQEAEARDHRKLGKQLDLFTFDASAPASPFFLPRGTKIYRQLIEFVRALYLRDGYEEVITPQIYSNELYVKSGHLANYRENMYIAMTSDDFAEAQTLAKIAKAMTTEGNDPESLAFLAAKTRGVKPMNCPGHAQLFSHRKRSYRELPWRCADFGRLHRYERGGVIHGLARVRSFCQDDAHIFCTPNQVHHEIVSFNRTLDEIYKAFGFTEVSIKLATRPAKHIGHDDLWARAERMLEEALKAEGRAFEMAEGEGAFYGPKLEFHVKDAIGRSWQLGTIQVDFSTPERFDLRYVDEQGHDQIPVMLHRVILGSLERFFAVYLEHCAGHFPMWLAPEQICLLTVSEKVSSYAQQVAHSFRAQGLRVAIDIGPEKLGAKIRNALLYRYPYIAVIGAKEAEQQTLSVRTMNQDIGSLTCTELMEKLVHEAKFPIQNTISF